MGTTKSSGNERQPVRTRASRRPLEGLHESLLHIFRENRGQGDAGMRVDTERAIRIEHGYLAALRKTSAA